MQSQRPLITVIGDSTIDNKAWVGAGVIGTRLRTKLGIKRDSSATRIKKSHRFFFKPELSIVEQLTDVLTDYEVCDLTNDGFTTQDLLHGNYRDKVFGEGTFDIFPHTKFNPLVEGQEAIKKSQQIILSIGGNNIREFLDKTMRIKNDYERRHQIRTKLPKILENLEKEYIEVVTKVRELNPNATLILMTQYYPSAMQNHYKIYPFMQEVGEVLGYGNNPMDTIQQLVRSTYVNGLNKIDKSNVIVADVTSTLNPFDKENHVWQIEPSEKGGRTITRLLHTIINNTQQFKGKAISLDPFTEQVCEMPINEHWYPRHPHQFTSYPVHELLRQIITERNKYAVGSEMYQAADQVYKEGNELLSTINPKSYTMASIHKSLELTLNVLKNPTDRFAIQALKYDANSYAVGTPSFLKKFFGALLMVLAAASLMLKVAAIPVTGGLSVGGTIFDVGAFALGAGLFYSGMRKSLSKTTNDLANVVMRKP